MTLIQRYAASGVDEPREQTALAGMLRSFAKTLSIRNGVGSVVAEHDHFGSLIQLTGGLALAIATDGVGTKLMIAQELKRYHDIAHDLVANNVNDILCMGATPIALVDYIGIDVADEEFLESFASGLADAAMIAGVSIVGGEIAQIGGLLNPAHGTPRFDVVATAIGLCHVDPATDSEWPVALDRNKVTLGDILVGLPSSGLHSNGFSLARRVLVTEAGLSLTSKVEELDGKLLGDVLLTPTKIYVKCILPLLKMGLVTGIANISGGGLLTISRLNPQLGFSISHLPDVPPIFSLIQRLGALSQADMMSTFNMGLGMVLSVRPENCDAVMDALRLAGEAPFVVGKVAEPSVKGEIIIPSCNLRGVGHGFYDLTSTHDDQ